jgi:hypothetical protein
MYCSPSAGMTPLHSGHGLPLSIGNTGPPLPYPALISLIVFLIRYFFKCRSVAEHRDMHRCRNADCSTAPLCDAPFSLHSQSHRTAGICAPVLRAAPAGVFLEYARAEPHSTVRLFLDVFWVGELRSPEGFS